MLVQKVLVGYGLLFFQFQDSRTFTIQLLGKDDAREDDCPAIIDRWNQYMESYQKVTFLHMGSLRNTNILSPCSGYSQGYRSGESETPLFAQVVP